MALVLKTRGCKSPVGSNPTASASQLIFISCSAITLPERTPESGVAKRFYKLIVIKFLFGLKTRYQLLVTIFKIEKAKIIIIIIKCTEALRSGEATPTP